MTLLAFALLVAFEGLFVWLVGKALHANTVYGLGWSVTKARTPRLFWLCVAAYLLNAILGLFLLLLLLPATLSAAGTP